MMKRIDPSLLILSVAMILGGIAIAYRGRVWDVVLGEARFIIGGGIAIVGVIIAIANLMRSSDESKKTGPKGPE